MKPKQTTANTGKTGHHAAGSNVAPGVTRERQRALFRVMLLIVLGLLIFVRLRGEHVFVPEVAAVIRGAAPEQTGKPDKAVPSAAVDEPPPAPPPPPKTPVHTPVLRGRVLDLAGKPVAGAEVRMEASSAAWSTATTSSGHFSLLPEHADAVMIISKPGWATARRATWELQYGPVSMSRAGELRGRVTAAGGQPIADVRVCVEQEGGWQHETTPAADGSFVVAPPSGAVRVTAHSAEWADHSVDALCVPGGITECGLVLERGVTLHARFVDPDGTGIEGARVRVRTEAGDAEEAWTSPDGSVAIAGLSSGGATLIATRGGYGELIQTISIAQAGGEEERCLAMSPCAPWSLALSWPEGATGGEGWVRIERLGQVLFEGTPTDAASQILVAGRTYGISCALPGLPRMWRRWEVPAEGSALLSMRARYGSRFFGTVCNASGRPVAGARVRFVPLDGDDGTEAGAAASFESVFTRHDGTFASELLPGGHYQLEVLHGTAGSITLVGNMPEQDQDDVGLGRLSLRTTGGGRPR